MMYVTEQDDYWTSIDEKEPLKQSEKCYAITFSKDGTIMVSGCSNFVKIWSCSNNGDLKFNPKSFVLKAHHKDVNTLYYSKKRNLFLSGSDDKHIKVWLLGGNNQFALQQDLANHTHWVTQVIMNDAEDTMFSADWDGNLIIWQSVNNGAWQIKSIQKLHEEQIHSICLNLDQNILASVGWDQKINILQKENDWKSTQVIPLENQGFRVGFMSENQLVMQPKLKSTTQIFQQNMAKFEKKAKGIDLTRAEDDSSYFPIQYLRAQQLLVVKHYKHVQLIKKINSETFVLQKSMLLDDQRTFGQINEAFNLLVTWDCRNRAYKVQKF